MVDAPGPEPTLGDLEAAALAEEDVRLRDADAREGDLGVTVRSVVVTEDGERPVDLDAMAAALLDLLDAIEGLLGPRVLGYAARPAGP